MKSLNTRWNPYLLYGLLISICASMSTARADDSELYVLNLSSSAGVQPRVMILFDDSGSMDSSVAAPIPFTPTTTYSKIYWSTDGSVPKSSSSNYFTPAYNNCNASITPLNTIGYYADHFESLQAKTTTTGSGKNKVTTTTYSWGNLNTTHTNYVDCQSDINKSDTANPGWSTPLGYPLSGTFATQTAAYGTSGTKASFISATATYLFTSDYVNWYYSTSGAQHTSTRLAVAKQTITDLITSTPAVDYGLATFNMNVNNSDTPGSDDGGRIVFPSKNANDTASTTDTNEGFRTSLITTINSLSSDTWTPLSESFYELAHYWQGGTVWKGTWPGGYYSNGYGTYYYTATPGYDATAMSSDLKKYVSPFNTCHNHGYNIIVTDGAPTHDTAANALIASEFINSTKLSSTELASWGKTFREGANKRVLSSQADSPIKISRVWTDYFSRKHLESAYLDRFFAVSGVIPGF